MAKSYLIWIGKVPFPFVKAPRVVYTRRHAVGGSAHRSCLQSLHPLQYVMSDVAMQATKPCMLLWILLQHRRGRLRVRCNFQVLAWNSTLLSPTGWDTPIGSNIRFENSIPRPQLPLPSPVDCPPLGTGISKVGIIAENVVHTGEWRKAEGSHLSLHLHHFISLNLAHIWSPRAIGTLFKGLGRKVVLDMRAKILTPYSPPLRKMQISGTKRLYKGTPNIRVIMQNSILSRSPSQDHHWALAERSIIQTYKAQQWCYKVTSIFYFEMEENMGFSQWK